jgi:hypothetical protein
VLAGEVRVIVGNATHLEERGDLIHYNTSWANADIWKAFQDSADQEARGRPRA